MEKTLTRKPKNISKKRKKQKSGAEEEHEEFDELLEGLEEEVKLQEEENPLSEDSFKKVFLSCIRAESAPLIYGEDPRSNI